MLEGLFGEADAEAMDADLDLNPTTDNVGMDVEDEAAVTADPGMIVDDDYSAGPLCVLQPAMPIYRIARTPRSDARS